MRLCVCQFHRNHTRSSTLEMGKIVFKGSEIGARDDYGNKYLIRTQGHGDGVLG